MTLTPQEINKSALTAALIVQSTADSVLQELLVQLRNGAERSMFTTRMHESLARATHRSLADISVEYIEDVVTRIFTTLERKFARTQ